MRTYSNALLVDSTNSDPKTNLAAGTICRLALILLLLCFSVPAWSQLSGGETTLSAAQLSAIGRPNPAVCIDATAVPQDGASLPGAWRESGRFGQGWDLLAQGDQLTAVWYTYGTNRRPVWYQSTGMALDVASNEGSALLYEHTPGSLGQLGSNPKLVGGVAFRFFRNMPDRAVVRIQFSSGQLREACLFRTISGNNPTVRLRSPTDPNPNALLFSTSYGASERLTLATFDTNGVAVWLASKEPVAGSRVLDYYYSNYPGNNAWNECNHSGCVSAPRPVGNLAVGAGQRSSDPIPVVLSAVATIAEVGQQLNAQYPTAQSGASMSAVLAHTLSAGPNPCLIPAGQTNCNVTVSWNFDVSTGTPNIGVYRKLEGSSAYVLLSSLYSGTIVDSVPVGNYRYYLARRNSNGSIDLNNQYQSTGIINVSAGSGGGPGNTIGFRDLSMCPASPTPIAPGDVPGVPGLYWNPDRETTGWFLSFSTNGPSKTAIVTWLTYDAQGKRRWYATAPAEIADIDPAPNSTVFAFWAPLLRYQWVGNQQGQGTQVGEVSITFSPTDATRSGLHWKLGESQIEKECLREFRRGDQARGAENLAYSGYWYDPLQQGWGFLAYIFQPQSTVEEYHSLTVYDTQGSPTWLDIGPFASSTNLTTAVPVHYRMSPFPAGLPTGLPLPAAQWPPLQVAGSLNREFLSAATARLVINARLPTAQTPTELNWDRGTLASPLPIAKIFRVDEITTSRQVCTLTATDNCPVTVSWTSTFDSARAWRRNLATQTIELLPSTNRTDSIVQTFVSPGSFQYFLSTSPGGGSPLAVSAAVVIHGLLPAPVATATGGLGYRLNWQAVSSGTVDVGFSTSVSTTPTSATATGLTGTQYDGTVPAAGTYYFFIRRCSPTCGAWSPPSNPLTLANTGTVTEIADDERGASIQDYQSPYRPNTPSVLAGAIPGQASTSGWQRIVHSADCPSAGPSRHAAASCVELFLACGQWHCRHGL